MKRVIIICEGQTEQSFCKNILQPHFNSLGVWLQTPTIKKTGGGIVAWQTLKKEIELYLSNDKTACVTMLMDYYGLNARLEYPNWSEAEQTADKNERMNTLEQGMKNDVREELRYRFYPYIQLHEFEGLLFSDISVFDRKIPIEKLTDYSYLESTIREHPNPETINKGTDTAPSKRLKKIIKNYGKVFYGSLLAQEIGLTKIREKCPRFNNWISQIENL